MSSRRLVTLQTMKRLLIAVALAIPLAANAADGNPDDYVRYLVPVIQRDLRGANGSVWTSELKFRNRWHRPISLIGPPPCNPNLDPVQGCSSSFSVAAQFTDDFALQARGDGADGGFLYVPKSLNDL